MLAASFVPSHAFTKFKHMPSETDGTSNMWSQGLSQTSHLIFIDLPNLFHLGKIVRVNKLLCRGNQGRNSWIDGEGLWITEDHQEAWLSTDGWGSVWMAFHIFLRFCTNEFRQHAILCFILLCLIVFYNQDLFSAG